MIPFGLASLMGKSFLQQLAVPLIAVAVIGATTVFVLILKGAGDSAVNKYENKQLIEASRHKDQTLKDLVEQNESLSGTEKKLRTEVDHLKKTNAERKEESGNSTCTLGCIES